MRADLAQQQAHATRQHVPPAQPAAGLTWQRRLALILHAPTEAEVDGFIATQVRPALDQVAKELSTRGRPSSVVEEEGGAIALRSPAEGVRDFIYGVSRSAQPVATFSPLAGKSEYRHEARTYFSSGSRGYDIMGMNRDQIIADVLVQFERYLQLAHSPATQLVHGAPEHELDPPSQ
jgi:choline/glycine/proline betaine transport protein